MIEQLHLKNIQKHTELTVNFAPGITVLYGDTESGKTSTLRGLLWAMTNNESGDVLVNHHAKPKTCSATVTVDGNTVVRSWGAKLNTYALNGSEFKSFKTTVPSDIAELFNLSPVAVQSRRDLPFMVYYKASENAAQFAEMLDIVEIQRTVTNSNALVKTAEKTLESLEAEYAVAESVMRDLELVQEAKVAYNQITEVKEKVARCTHLLEGITKQADMFHMQASRKQELSSGIEAVKAWKPIEDIVTKVNASRGALKSILALVASYTEAGKTVTTAKQLLAVREDFGKLTCHTLKRKEVADATDRLKSLFVRISQASAVMKRYTLYDKAGQELKTLQAAKHVVKVQEAKIATVQEYVARIKNAEQRLAAAKTEKSDAVKAFESILGVPCPTCGAPIRG